MPTHKTWSIVAVSLAGAAVTYHRDGAILFGGAAGSGDAGARISPVEYLLVAAAGCLALSARAVLARSKIKAGSVEVTATGEKAAEPPSRLGRITLAVSFDGAEIDPAGAIAILEQAEKMCTVSNTLLGAPVIVVHSVNPERARAGPADAG